MRVGERGVPASDCTSRRLRRRRYLITSSAGGQKRLRCGEASALVIRACVGGLYCCRWSNNNIKGLYRDSESRTMKRARWRMGGRWEPTDAAGTLGSSVFRPSDRTVIIGYDGSPLHEHHPVHCRTALLTP